MNNDPLQQNPYAVPDSIDHTTLQRSSNDNLRRIAIAQQNVNFGALCYLALALVATGLQFMTFTPEVGYLVVLALRFASVVLVVFCAFAIFRLTSELQHIALAFLFALLILVPFLGLLLMAAMSQQATEELKKHGIRVGLMGASLKDIPS